MMMFVFFFFQAEDGIRDVAVTGVQTCALPISGAPHLSARAPGHQRSPLLPAAPRSHRGDDRSEEHTSNSSHGYISYAVFCLKKKKTPPSPPAVPAPTPSLFLDLL